MDYVRIPAKSPHFDAEWAKNGHIEAAIRQAEKWVAAQGVKGLALEIVRIEGRTPVLFFDIPATGGLSGSRTVLFYGHLDKQPEMTGWRKGLGPWIPVYEDGKLYGRGGADDGYAVFAAISAVMALDAEGIARPRCVGLIETCEESGSYDLPAYLELLAPRMGEVELVVALDSGAGNYEQLWVTTSLRGLVNGTLEVKVIEEGVHSGDAGGVVPSSFRIARQILDRVDDSRTGVVKPAAFNCDIPAERVDQARQAAAILGESMWRRFPWASCCDDQGTASLLRGARDEGPRGTRARPHLARGARGHGRRRVAADGLGRQRAASAHHAQALASPAAARRRAEGGPGLPRAAREGPALSRASELSWRLRGHGLELAARRALAFGRARCPASEANFGKPAAYMGEGGTIPFMGMLGVKFPEAQMLVTGVLGPKSNAHGPNEFLHVPYAKKVTLATAMVIAAVR